MKKYITMILSIVILLASTITLASCDLYDFFGYTLSNLFVYNTHTEFIEFVEKYNSQNDGFASTFISFDLDSNEMVLDRLYTFKGLVYYRKGKDTIFDKYQDNMSVGMYFYMNDIDEYGMIEDNIYQICCEYDPNMLNYNFDGNDEITLRLSDNIEYDSIDWEKYSNDLLINPDKIKFNYVGCGYLSVNGIDLINIYIGSKNKDITQEKLNEICTLLKDNLVIINTEG